MSNKNNISNWEEVTALFLSPQLEIGPTLDCEVGLWLVLYFVAILKFRRCTRMYFVSCYVWKEKYLVIGNLAEL